MKKMLFAFAFAALILPAHSEQVEIPNTESVRYFSQPQYSRFRYDLPEGNPFSFRKDNKAKVENEDGDITLDEEDVKPVKKVIKKLSDNPKPNEQPLNREDMPMNYDSFPKYYDANDMMQQQFLPMPTSTF